jgi:DNA (cytosine-5)-methyltransferase 1
VITFGSLFAGIGGLDLGLERAGMKCLWRVEKDDYATSVLEKRWPGIARYRDVRDCGAGNLEAVDLICGGFPCQDVSLAGKMAGAAGARSSLWTEFARVIRELKPGWVLVENVPGLLSNDHGRFFGTVLRDLAACGYDAEWDCLSAAQFGAPHLRFRVFLIAYSHGRIERRGVFEEWQSDRRNPDVARDGAKGGVANSDGNGDAQGERDYEAWRAVPAVCDWWAAEPEVGRVADGIPNRMDRLRCLGNAVVPQVAEWIGRRIAEVER